MSDQKTTTSAMDTPPPLLTKFEFYSDSQELPTTPPGILVNDSVENIAEKLKDPVDLSDSSIPEWLPYALLDFAFAKMGYVKASLPDSEESMEMLPPPPPPPASEVMATGVVNTESEPVVKGSSEPVETLENGKVPETQATEKISEIQETSEEPSAPEFMHDQPVDYMRLAYHHPPLPKAVPTPGPSSNSTPCKRKADDNAADNAVAAKRRKRIERLRKSKCSVCKTPLRFRGVIFKEQEGESMSSYICDCCDGAVQMFERELNDDFEFEYFEDLQRAGYVDLKKYTGFNERAILA